MSDASADGHPVPLQPFENRHQCDRDDERGGGRQEELGARLERERRAERQPDAGDQRERGEQAVAPEHDARLLFAVVGASTCGANGGGAIEDASSIVSIVSSTLCGSAPAASSATFTPSRF